MTTFSAVQAAPGRAIGRDDVRDRTDVRRVRLELTRRGRAVVGTLVFLAVLLASAIAAVALDVPAAFASWGQEQQYVSVTVQPGDTLWGYAQEYAPAGTDPRDFLFEIQQANGLSNGQITAGTQVDIPVEG